MSDLSLTLQLNPLLFIVLTLVITAISYFVYRVTVPPIPGGLKTVLIFLRTAGLVAVLMFFFEPVVTVATRTETPPRVALLVDNSKSMQLVDGGGDRAEITRNILNHPALNRLASGDNLTTIRFAERPSLLADFAPDSFRLDGAATNINDAILKLHEIRERGNVQFALLISDGNYNIGARPVYAAERLGIPLYTIGVGDTLEQKDILVARVVANEFAYIDTRVPIDVRVRSSGFGGERVNVSLEHGQRVIDEKMIMLEEGTAEYDLTFTFEPEEEGLQRYTVRVQELPDEVTYENNFQSFYVRVLEHRIRVLLIAGAPSQDAVFVRRVLEQDESVTVHAAFQQPGIGFIGDRPTQERVREADLVILIGFPDRTSDSSVVGNIVDTVRDTRTPVLFLESIHADVNRIEELLPVVAEQINRNERQTFISINDRYGAHTLFRMDDGSRLTGWNALPPVFRTMNRYSARPGAETLMTHGMQSMQADDPFLVVRSVAGGKSAAILGYGLWRWRMLGRSEVDGEKMYDQLITNLVHWLTTEDDRDRVRIASSREHYFTGDPIEFSGQVYDEQYRPLSNAEMRVSVQSAENRYETILSPRGYGRYEGALSPLPEGDYRFTGIAEYEGTEIGGDDGRFNVGERNPEFRDTRMNVQLLRRLAAMTGGAYLHAGDGNQIDELLGDIGKYESLSISSSRDYQMWNLPAALITVIIFFSAEWFLRKRNGML